MSPQKVLKKTYNLYLGNYWYGFYCFQIWTLLPSNQWYHIKLWIWYYIMDLWELWFFQKVSNLIVHWFNQIVSHIKLYSYKIIFPYYSFRNLSFRCRTLEELKRTWRLCDEGDRKQASIGQIPRKGKKCKNVNEKENVVEQRHAWLLYFFAIDLSIWFIVLLFFLEEEELINNLTKNLRYVYISFPFAFKFWSKSIFNFVFGLYVWCWTSRSRTILFCSRVSWKL